MEKNETQNLHTPEKLYAQSESPNRRENSGETGETRHNQNTDLN